MERRGREGERREERERGEGERERGERREERGEGERRGRDRREGVSEDSLCKSTACPALLQMINIKKVGKG